MRGITSLRRRIYRIRMNMRLRLTVYHVKGSDGQPFFDFIMVTHRPEGAKGGGRIITRVSTWLVAGGNT